MIVSFSHSGHAKPCKRLQLVFRATYFVIALSRKVNFGSAKILGPILQRTASYIALDVDHERFLDVDKNALVDLVKEKNNELLSQYGGTKKVAELLETDEKNGISRDLGSLKQRIDAFGSNTYQKPPARSFISFVAEALKDTTIIVLLVCAVLALGFGIKQHGPKEGWYDGGSIIVAVILVLAVSAISNFKQSRQFMKLSKESGNIKVEVLRDGRRQQISIFDIVVGDIVCLKIGDQIPADGLFLDGHSLKVDESSMTGESDQVEIHANHPFLLSGTKVTDGFGHMLVTSVGMKTTWGQMMSSITHEMSEQTPLQERLNKLTSYIGKVGMLVAFLVLVVLMIRYFTGNTLDESGQKEFIKDVTKANDIMNSMVRIIAAAITIIVVAIPEGLPLAVTLTLAYSMRRMMLDHAMVRKLSACETMGSATTICTDKTGTLTLNKMQVTEFWLGEELFKKKRSELNPEVLQLLLEGAGLNTTGEVHLSPSSNLPEISGSPTESAILFWAVSEMGLNTEQLKQQYEILFVETFNSKKKSSGILARDKSTKAIHLHMKGAAEMILALCSHYFEGAGMLIPITDGEKAKLETIIQDMASRSLRCIAFACKSTAEESHMGYKELQDTGLTLLGLVGLKDPCRPEVKAAVESVNVAALVINFVAAISSGEVPLTAVQLLWVNLIMDTLGALALATEQPTDELMTNKPVGRTEPLITKIMWRNLLAQALYQVSVLLVLQFKGSSIFGVNKNTKDTLIFNSFVLCQIFNEFNSRKMESRNIFSGILKNRLFISIIGITMVLQLVMVEFLNRFANTNRLNWEQWAACIGIAALSWPIGWLVKCIPVTRE